MAKELFELNTPDCVSSRDNVPMNGMSITYFPARITENSVEEYDNPWIKWKGRGCVGVFKNTTNLITDPEDLTTSNWTTNGTGSRELTDKYINGKRFTKITSTSSYYVYQYLSASSADYCVSFIAKKDTSAQSRILITGGVGIDVVINWSVETGTITYTIGTDVGTTWIVNNELVWVKVKCASNPNGQYLRFYGANTVTGNTYYTAVQFENSTYPTPYVSKSRGGGKIEYQFDWPQKGTIECWVYPWFTYNVTSHNIAIDSRSKAGISENFFVFRYDYSNDKWLWQVRDDDSNYIEIRSTTAFTGDTDFQQWTHFKGTWDVEKNEIKFWQNGVLQNGETVSGSGISNADFSVNKLLGIGREFLSETNQYNFDGLITDLAIKDYIDESDEHYKSGKPYYTNNRVLGKNCDWKIW